MCDTGPAQTEGSLGYAVIFEEQEEQEEWEESCLYIGSDDVDDYVEAARRLKEDGCRNVRVVELIAVEREVFRP